MSELSVRVETSEPGPVRRELRIEVEPPAVADVTREVIERLARSVRLPGFRKGKVPQSVVKKRFLREIENDVLERLVPRALRESLISTGLQPVHQPVITEVSLKDGQPLQFTASFEIRPHIEPRDYRGLAIQDSGRSVEEKDVERELERLRDQSAEYAAVEPRPLTAGDHALLDLTTVIDGDANPQEGVLVEIGNERFHPDFNRNLEGLEPGGSRSFRVEYGEDDPDPDARGKVVDYSVSLREIKRKTLPELDDDFARDVSPHQSLDELRQALRAELGRYLERHRRHHLESQVMQQLVATVDAEMPKAMVEQEIDRQISEQMRAMAAEGIDPRTAPIDWRETRESIRESAESAVKWELLLDAIAAKEQIAGNQEAVDERLQRIANESRKSLEFVRAKIEKDGRMEELKQIVTREKTVDFLLLNATIEKR